MRVARAEEAHLPQIMERWTELMDMHKEIDPHFVLDPRGRITFEMHLRSCMASEKDILLVALEKDEVLGYMLAHISKRPPVFEEKTFGEISDLAVRKDHWRKGVGERMLKTALKWFGSKGISRIEVRTSPKNPVAMAFWQKQGFLDHFHAMYLEI